jgi:hypothetical protein
VQLHQREAREVPLARGRLRQLAERADGLGETTRVHRRLDGAVGGRAGRHRRREQREEDRGQRAAKTHRAGSVARRQPFAAACLAPRAGALSAG